MSDDADKELEEFMDLMGEQTGGFRGMSPKQDAHLLHLMQNVLREGGL